MATYQDVVSHGGSYIDKGQGWIVSFWYIPGGYDYVNAEVKNAFFEFEEGARRFSRQNEMPPEMADLMTREQYETMKALSKAPIPSGKKWRT